MFSSRDSKAPGFSRSENDNASPGVEFLEHGSPAGFDAASRVRQQLEVKGFYTVSLPGLRGLIERVSWRSYNRGRKGRSFLLRERPPARRGDRATDAGELWRTP